MPKYTNFPGHFPGEYYREMEIDPDLSKDLDGILSEMNFDLERFQRLRKRKDEKGVREEVDTLLEPVYNRMIQLGYTHEQLCR